MRIARDGSFKAVSWTEKVATGSQKKMDLVREIIAADITRNFVLIAVNAMLVSV